MRTQRNGARGLRIVSTLVRLEPFGPLEDPDGAPGQRDCNDPGPRWTLRRGMRNGLPMYLFGLVFMIFSVTSLVTASTGPLETALAGTQILLIAVLYVGGAWVSDSSYQVRWIYLGVFLLLVFSTAIFLGSGFVTFGAYAAVLMATLIPWRLSRILIGSWGLGLAIFGFFAGTWWFVTIGVIAIAVGWAIGMGIEQSRVADKLRRTELRASGLAVAAERERIARDLHDILGHSLTAVSIKSGLAAKLVDADPAAARAEMAEVERIARQALADVRATASGMREVRLATEIASARSVLESAGVTAQTPTALDPASEGTSELLGYVVREAVTNVVRHSGATRCVITAGPDWVSISDDGRGLGDRADASGVVRSGEGSGLNGLRQRIESAGGQLELTPGFLAAERSAGAGTTVRAVLDPVRAAVRPAGSSSGPVVSVTPGTVPEIVT